MKDKKEAIYEATIRLISEYGFHGTPMSKIAKEAGVSVGIIYHYFENKDELIDQLYRTKKIEFSQKMLQNLSEESPLKENLITMWKNTITFSLQNKELLLFIEQYANSPLLTTETEEALADTTKPIIAKYKQAIETNLIKDLPFELFSAFTFGVAIHLAKKHLMGFIALTDDLIQQAAEMCWDAIKK